MTIKDNIQCRPGCGAGRAASLHPYLRRYQECPTASLAESDAFIWTTISVAESMTRRTVPPYANP